MLCSSKSTTTRVAHAWYTFCHTWPVAPELSASSVHVFRTVDRAAFIHSTGVIFAGFPSPTGPHPAISTAATTTFRQRTRVGCQNHNGVSRKPVFVEPAYTARKARGRGAAVQIEVSEIRSVLILGDGWYDIEPDSFTIGAVELAAKDDMQQLGRGFQFRSGNLGVITGPTSVIAAISTMAQPPLRSAD